MQRNETLWTRALLEGGAARPQQRQHEPADWDPLAHPSCALTRRRAANLAEARKYTGVQDYDDYDEGPNPYFYDPDDAAGRVGCRLARLPGADGPRAAAVHGRRPGRAELRHQRQPRRAGAGQRGAATRPSRTSPPAASRRSARTSSRCRSPDGLDPSALLAPPRPACWSRPIRCGGSSTSARSRRSTGRTARTTRTATTSSTRTRTSTRTSRPATTPGTRPRRPASGSSPSTRCPRAASSEQSANGNIDDPQFQWLERELQFASADDKLIVLFGHHPIRIAQLERAGRGGGRRARASTTPTATRPSTTTTPAATSTRAPRRRSTSASRASAAGRHRRDPVELLAATRT